jgi:Fe-S cluster assembly protein SufD
MTTATQQTSSSFIDAFGQIEKRFGAEGQSWFAPVRQAAIARFAKLGFPTPGDEDWRFTNVASIANGDFELARPVTVGPDAISPYLFKERHRITLVNGHFSAELSDLGNLPRGLRVIRVTEGLRQAEPAFKQNFARHAQFDDQAFTALNTAFVQDGAYIEIAREQVIEDPIHIVHLSVNPGRPSVSYPRTLVVAGANSQATIVESYVGPGGEYLNNAVTEVSAAEGAVIDHYRVQRESEAAYHVGLLHIYQGRSSNVRSTSVNFGGGLVRNDVVTILDGEGADCTLNGLYMTHGRQHVDNHLRVEHAQPHCHSWEYYKGILDGGSRGVFTGRIVVHKGAQKTDAKQTNMNLLLSREAQVDTKPQLEIYADDVKCTHGATIGQIDDTSLFYLRARGIREAEARSILVYAFAAETLDQIRLPELRAGLESVLFERLPGGERLRGTLA